IEAYKAKWHAAKVALVGYSFGADILPIVYARLPEADKASVAQLSLLALSDSAEFEIKVAGWLGKSASDESLAVEPAFASVDGAQVQCFYGEAETDSLCPR